MAESTKEDWEIIGSYATGFNADLPNRILDHLKMLRDDKGQQLDLCFKDVPNRVELDGTEPVQIQIGLNWIQTQLEPD